MHAQRLRTMSRSRATAFGFMLSIRRCQCWGGLLVLLTLAACGGQASSPATATPVGATATVSGTTRPVMGGLTDMGSLMFHDKGVPPDNSLTAIEQFPGAFRGKVINATWAQLQPTSQSFDPATIDQALSAIAAYNQAHPTAPLLAKLRVFSTNNVPDWVKQLPGGPITVIDNAATGHPTTVTVGPFWTARYIQAWRQLQALLAARYDANPVLAVVASGSCASLSDEAFILPLMPPSSTNLLAAGFTDAAYQQCLLGQSDDYAAWRQVRIEETFNLYHHIDRGKVIQDMTVTTQAMQQCRSALGARCVLSNHGLQLPDVAAADGIYAKMKTLGPPISLQDYSPKTLQSATTGSAVMKKAIGIGAASVEVWPSEFTKFPPATVQQWAQLFPTV